MGWYQVTDAEKEKMRFLRMEGLGYGAVAERLGLSENTVKSYCRRNHLTGFGSGAEGAEILLRGLPEGMVAVASGAGTPGGVLCAGLWALRTGVSELWK